MRTEHKQSEFNKIFTTGSHGATGHCHCGVIHYDTANKWDDDHHDVILPSAELAAKSEPESFQFHDTAISYVDFNGHLYVIGCKCGMDDFIFNFLKEDKEKILFYYRKTKDRIEAEDSTND